MRLANRKVHTENDTELITSKHKRTCKMFTYTRAQNMEAFCFPHSTSLL